MYNIYNYLIVEIIIMQVIKPLVLLIELNSIDESGLLYNDILITIFQSFFYYILYQRGLINIPYSQIQNIIESLKQRESHIIISRMERNLLKWYELVNKYEQLIDRLVNTYCKHNIIIMKSIFVIIGSSISSCKEIYELNFNIPLNQQFSKHSSRLFLRKLIQENIDFHSLSCKKIFIGLKIHEVTGIPGISNSSWKSEITKLFLLKSSYETKVKRKHGFHLQCNIKSNKLNLIEESGEDLLIFISKKPINAYQT